jgi:hypothetical protein
MKAAGKTKANIQISREEQEVDIYLLNEQTLKITVTCHLIIML